MEPEVLTLRGGSWYVWSMFPGYGSSFVPYVCPIKVIDVKPEKTGASTLTLDFINSGYADGVQDFRLQLRVLARRRHHLVAELLYGPGSMVERHAIIGRIGREWLDASGYDSHKLLDNCSTTQAQIDAYLDVHFRLAR